MKKRKSFKMFLIFVFLAVAVWWVGTFALTVTVTNISSSKIKNDATIVHVTDLHGSSFGEDNSWLVSKISDQLPDIICVTGDMFTTGDAEGRILAKSFFEQIVQIAPVYSVTGEHEIGSGFYEEIKEFGVNVLEYDDEIIDVNGNNIHVYGINTINYSSTFDLTNEFVKDNENFNLLLAHVSNFKAFADFGMNLSLCGDTHGGQVRLPYIGAIFNRGVWLPELKGTDDAIYTDGLYEIDDSLLYVSSGLGNSPYPIRFMNLPEISVIKLTGVE